MTVPGSIGKTAAWRTYRWGNEENRMRENDPNYPETTRPAGDPRRDPPMVQNSTSSNMGMIGVIAGIAIALVVGFLFWNMSDTTDTASDTTTPGQTTTGSAPKAPASPSTGTGATGTTPPANNAPANQGSTPAPSR